MAVVGATSALNSYRCLEGGGQGVSGGSNGCKAQKNGDALNHNFYLLLVVVIISLAREGAQILHHFFRTSRVKSRKNEKYFGTPLGVA